MSGDEKVPVKETLSNMGVEWIPCELHTRNYFWGDGSEVRLTRVVAYANGDYYPEYFRDDEGGCFVVPATWRDMEAIPGDPGEDD